MGLCDLFGVPHSALGEVTDNAGALGMSLAEHFGVEIAITGMAGDQQAATIGQSCQSLGETKATYGTGAFVLTNMGNTAPKSLHRLLGTVLCQISGTRSYALEGSVFVAGSLIQWLRDAMGLIVSPAEAEQLARSVPDTGGVVLVPALSGLGAPHWQPEARASITGMSFATTRAHVVRAALEAMAAQTCDLATAFAADGAPWTSLRIDGGMSANDWIAQDLADMLNLPVERPEFVETTALGAAMLAGFGAGMFGTVAEAVKSMRGKVRDFAPAFSDDQRHARLEAWHAALAKV
jgi:glycerol kinase